MFGHPEIFLRDLEASRVEVNNGYFFSALRQHGGEISASAAENKNVVVSTQKRFHDFHVGKLAMPERRTMTLEYFVFQIEARAVSFVFPNCYIAKLAAEPQKYFHV